MPIAYPLKSISAPAFSLMGFVVRIRGTNNPDKTWVQPDIVMWGYVLTPASPQFC